MRVLFIDFDGVLHAVAGPPPTMRMFVWAPILESILSSYPDVRLVVHASARDHTPPETITTRLGKLGEKVVGIAPPKVPRWAAIQQYLEQNPNITSHRILDDSPLEFPVDLAELIVCSPNKGISEPDVQAQILDWLRAN